MYVDRGDVVADRDDDECSGGKGFVCSDRHTVWQQNILFFLWKENASQKIAQKII